jgi:hypothetical protein
MNNKKIFAEYMTVLGEIHGKEISKTLAESYFEILKPYSDNECITAFKLVIKNSKFFPKPAEILELLESKNKLSSSEAWGKVIDCLTYGRQSENPTISKAISALGGWDYLSKLSYDDLHWQEKRFKEYFNDFQNKNDFDQDLIEFKDNILLID